MTKSYRWGSTDTHGDAVYGAGPGPEPTSIRTRDGRVLDLTELLPRP